MAVVLTGVSRIFPNGHAGVRHVDLTVADGELLVLVGPSGCGKSTLLRLIAGLEPVTSGRVAIDGVDVTQRPPQERDVAMVFQSYALYPHMTVRENLGYGLRVRRAERHTIAARVSDIASALDLAPLLDRRPAQLSGGQRQRVALGRALVRDPKAFLLDEPLSNLDPALRLQARAELLRLHHRLPATMIYVTHDQEEAMTLGDRVAVMDAGAIVQAAPPAQVYSAPATTFVARFIGSPPINLIEHAAAGVDVPPGVTLGVRPHHVGIDGDEGLPATVDLVEPRGPDAIVHLRADDGVALVAVTTAAPPQPGSRVHLRIDPAQVLRFDAATGRRLDAS